MRWLDGIAESVDMSLSKLQEIVKNREAWQTAINAFRNRHYLVTKQQQQPMHKEELGSPKIVYFF